MIAPEPTVLIDDRAGSKDLVKYPPLDRTGILCRLESGDALLSGNGPDGPVSIVVEVKSVSDLISSIHTGRLQAGQIPAMLGGGYDVVWLLCHGRYRCNPRDGIGLQVWKSDRWRNHKIGARTVPYGYVEAMLLTLSALGVLVRKVEDVSEAAAWLGVLSRWWSKPWEKHRGLHTFDKSRNISLMPGMDSGAHLRARVAAQLPGIGFGRAVQVANHFDSVRDMVLADVTEWEEVEGIGKTIARAVDEALGRA